MIQHTYLFPGQGSQKLGMGKELFGKYPQFMKQADGILGYSIEELCLNGTQEQLNQTQYTQPALYTVEALSYLSRCEITGEKPDYIAGHSLGEFAALFAANVYDFDEGLYLVAKRGELMAQATGGGMAAVIGLTLSQVTDVIARNRLKEIEIANLNSETQIIIAGPCDSIVKTEEVFRREKDLIKYVPLKVSGAFHSSYMQKARDQFYQVLAGSGGVGI